MKSSRGRWHLDETYAEFNGEPPDLWRAVDHEGAVLERFLHMAASHVPRGPGLVYEDQLVGIKVELSVEPVVALLEDVRAILLDSVAGPIFRVIP